LSLRQASAEGGGLVFTGAITPHTESGRLARRLSDVSAEAAGAKVGSMLIDVRTERVLAQAWRVHERLVEVLAKHGSTAGDLLRQRIFLRDMRDVAVIERVMGSFQPDPWPPTSYVLMSGEGLHPEIDIQLDAVAVADGASGERRELIGTAGPGAQARYAAAARARDLLFVANVAGLNPDTGQVAERLSELGPDGARFSGYRLTTEREERILVQTWLIFRRLEALLADQGASLSDVLQVNGWLSFGIRAYQPVIEVRNVLFGSHGLPASTALGVGGVLLPHAELTFDAIALLPCGGGPIKEELPPSAIGSFYVDAVGAAEFVFTCGEVPIDLAVPELIATCEQLPDREGRSLADGVIHEENGAQVRAWYVLERLTDDLARFGATLDDVVQQTVYLRNVADYPAVERVALRAFGGKLPPTTLVPITDTSPFWGAGLEIDMIAHRDV
jgi:enamine deaminase RidA (YjgF/YER057c/UK114 family)